MHTDDESQAQKPTHTWQRVEEKPAQDFRQANTELDAVLEQLRFQANILRNVQDSVIVTSLSGRIIYWNEATSAIFGYSAREMLGQKIGLVYPKLRRAAGARDLQSTAKELYETQEWEGWRKDGTKVWLDSKTTLLLDAEGNPSGFIGVAKDITARKQAQEELRQSEERYRQVVEHTNDLVSLLDLEGAIIYASPSYQRVLGFVPAERVNRSDIQELLHPDDVSVVRQAMASTLSGEPAFVPLLRIRHKDGHWIILEAFYSAIFDVQARPQMIVVTAHDITQHIELEKRKDAFISMVSHELRTPLTVVAAYTQLLAELFEGEKRGDIASYLSKVDDEINKLARITDDLLNVSWIQKHKYLLQMQLFDVDVFVHEVVANLQQTSPVHRIIVEGLAGQLISGDRDRLGQVLVNLLSNAIKYSPGAETIIVRVRPAPTQLVISVQDFGIGIPHRHQKQLFELFYRVHDDKDKTYPGLGIGLYIASEIIQHHGGKIRVESREGHGSTFSFSLPRARVAGQQGMPEQDD